MRDKITGLAIVFAQTAAFGASTGPSIPAQVCDSIKPETTPAERFDVRPTGEVYDKKTGLTWKACIEGRAFQDGRCEGTDFPHFSWRDASAKFASSSSDSWRLPTIDELKSIVEERCSTPAINSAVFPNTPVGGYWSASPDKQVPDTVWAVGFKDGKETPTSVVGKNAYLRGVRLVRGPKWVNAQGVAYQETQRAEAEAAELRSLAKSEDEAYVSCKGAEECNRAFSLAQVFITSHSDQKIQLVTDTVVETFNPTIEGNVGIKALKIPNRQGATVSISVMCNDDARGFGGVCRMKKLDIYSKFRPYMTKMLLQ